MKCLYEEETDMRYTLENENLKVEIDSFGAEIKSVKRNQITLNICGVVIKVLGRTSPVFIFRLSVRRKTKNTVMTENLYDGTARICKRYGVYIRDTDGREHLICTDRYCGNL